jgi:hypothetical protein
MITITKDKNILKIEVSGTNGFYALDINSGIFYGKKGSPIKTYPMSKYDLSRAFSNMNTALGSAIGRIVNWGECQTAALRRADRLEIFMGADKVDGLALGVRFDYSPDEYAFINENFTAFAKYVKETTADGTPFDYEKQKNFRNWLSWEQGRTALGQYAEHITEEMYRRVTNGGQFEYSVEEWGTIAYYLIRGRVWEYHEHNCTRIREYIGWCRAMEKTPNRQNNFMREYLETKTEFELRKTEFDNKKLRQNYEAKAKAFEFTFGNYSVVIPKETKDIIDEGVNMHHCVGGYVNDVLNGRTFIVFVRRTDTPDKCYITAQVHTDGTLGQYFLAYDRYISSDEDMAFKRAFAEHLAKNW